MVELLGEQDEGDDDVGLLGSPEVLSLVLMADLQHFVQNDELD